MSTTEEIKQLTEQGYKYGFVTEVEEDKVPKGLSEETIRLISRKKEEPAFMLQWRLQAYRRWLQMEEPTWANVHYPPIDYQDIVYYSAPKSKKALKSLDEVDPEVRRTFEKLGIPLEEQKRFSGVAVDAVFDSVSVATTFKEKLAELGIIFCSFSEAVQNHPELVRKYLGSVVPYTDNFFAALNAAVFSDGSFCYIPKGVRCPMELSTYFRINAADTGQFERTLIVAEEGAYVERGGDVTYHGPGQLVGYPIFDLREHREDLHWYLRQIEEALIRSLATFGIAAERNPGYTGVWTKGRKIASIGVHAKQWVTWHGFALNVTTELSAFDLIIPCGIPGVVMTSVMKELEAQRTASRGDAGIGAAVRAAVRAGFSSAFGFSDVRETQELRAL